MQFPAFPNRFTAHCMQFPTELGFAILAAPNTRDTLDAARIFGGFSRFFVVDAEPLPPGSANSALYSTAASQMRRPVVACRETRAGDGTITAGVRTWSEEGKWLWDHGEVPWRTDQTGSGQAFMIFPFVLGGQNPQNHPARTLASLRSGGAGASLYWEPIRT
eukprot:gene12174-biopygen9468